MSDPMDENIHLHLVTPNEHDLLEEVPPTQIMEADEEDDVVVPPPHPRTLVPDPDLPEVVKPGGISVKNEPSCPPLENDGVDPDRDPGPITLTLEEPSPGPLNTDDRVRLLESQAHRNQARLDGFSQELKILLVEINIVCEWITDNFGVELIDRASQLFKHIHDLEEIEELEQHLSLLKNKKSNSVRRSARRKSIKPKRTSITGATEPHSSSPEVIIPNKVISSTSTNSKKKKNRGRPKKRVTITTHSETEEDDEDDSLIEPPECVLNTDIETEDFFKDKESKKNSTKRIRKRSLKKVIKTENMKVEDGEAIPGDLLSREGDNQSEEPKKKKKWKAQPRSLMCEECGKILKADSSLRWHMLMHADLRPVKCTEPGCGKTFRDKSKLSQHAKIHNGEKSEKCRYCDRGFLRKKDLIVHERTHTGEKPYACTEPNCGKSFNIKDHLTIHLRVHTGERPYKCPTCEKSFSQANSLRIHKKIHLKQAADYVPPPRKPRAPRKNSTKSSSTAPAHGPHISDQDLHSQPDSHHGDLEDKPINLHDDGGSVPDQPTSTTTVSLEAPQQHSSASLFFQTSTLNLVDPTTMQSQWNFDPHQHGIVQQHVHPTSAHQQRFTTLGSLGAHMLSTSSSPANFKLQSSGGSYHSHSQQVTTLTQQQATSQSINIIRNPLTGQTNPFVPGTQFHDPANNFRHFQN